MPNKSVSAMSTNDNKKPVIEAQATSKPYVEKEHEVADKLGNGVKKATNFGINLFGKGVKLLAKGASSLDKKVNG